MYMEENFPNATEDGKVVRNFSFMELSFFSSAQVKHEQPVKSPASPSAIPFVSPSLSEGHL